MLELFVAVNSQTTSITGTVASPENEQDVCLAAEDFVENLFQKFARRYIKTSYGDSFMKDRVASPWNAFFFLSLLSYQAEGSVRNEYLQLLELPVDKTEIAKAGYGKHWNAVAKHLNMKMKIFVRSSIALKPDFVELGTQILEAEIERDNKMQNYRDRVFVAINNWVKAQLNVEPLFDQDDVGLDTDVIVVNTIKFARPWKKPFVTSDTTSRSFYLLDSFNNKVPPKNVPTMHISGRFRHGQLPDLRATFVELPFRVRNCADDPISLFLIRPDNPDLIEWSLNDFGNLNVNSLLTSTEDDIDLYLPKFSFVQKNKIKVPNLQNIVFQVGGRRSQFFPNFFSIQECMTIRETISVVVNETGYFLEESTGLTYNPDYLVSNRQERSVPSPVPFGMNYPFIAIIGVKGKSLNPLLVTKFPGRIFVDKLEDPTHYILKHS
ncbi:serine protease inhibitor 3/4-like [Venturia canescens]|uniref:serine protease inhibitor 3/4-like n=1 Tax=Venturia canescens TaxID=32260 RepID=UPI001C9C9114|nr:serine protease inhibitor 3/4-like [Venturia canescens]